MTREEDLEAELAAQRVRLAQVEKYAQHLRACPQFMAIRLQPESGWTVTSVVKACTCGFTKALNALKTGE